jgi:hypothetical protein
VANPSTSSPVTEDTTRSQLVLNIVPVEFSRATVCIGRVPFTNNEDYRHLRTAHRDTHVFRFDRRAHTIANISIRPATLPLGEVSEHQAVHDHLRLLGKVLQHSIVEWLRKHRTILKWGRPIVFWGHRKDARLLSRAIEACNLVPRHGLEVVARYSLDTRVLQIPTSPRQFYLALIIELDTSNVLDVPLDILTKAGLDLTARYVSRRPPTEERGFRPKPELLGAVATIEDDDVLLTDNIGEDRVPISHVWLEARQENLEAVVRVMYPRHAERILARLQQLRAIYTTAQGKLTLIRQTLEGLKHSHTVTTGDGLTMQFTDVLTPESPLFPQRIETNRPNLLFGPQGRNPSLYPDPAIQKWGPFKYMYNEKNEPVLAILCEAQHRGRVEQFIQALCHGFPDEAWETAITSQLRTQANPYQGGLIGKFRLRRMTLEYEEITNPDAPSYRHAANRLLNRLPKAPDLAIVQIRQAFKHLHGDQNPYLCAGACGFYERSRYPRKPYRRTPKDRAAVLRHRERAKSGICTPAFRS